MRFSDSITVWLIKNSGVFFCFGLFCWFGFFFNNLVWIFVFQIYEVILIWIREK